MEIPTILDLNRVEKKVDSLIILLEASILVQESGPLDAKKIAKLNGVPAANIYGDRFRHLLPLYGFSYYSTGRKRWPLSVLRDWNVLNERARSLHWESLAPEIKESIVLGDLNLNVVTLFEKFKDEITKIESEVLGETSSKNCI